MIVRVPPQLLTVSPGFPTLLVNEVVVLERCGCTVFIGARIDTEEVATAAAACTKEHDALILEFNKRLKESLDDPQERLLGEVIEEVLHETEKAFT